jgi:hypothetical protein
MATVPTLADYEGAKRDMDDLRLLLSGAADRSNPGHPDGTVTTRDAVTWPTVGKMFTDFQADAADLLANAADTLAIDGYLLFPEGHPAALDRIKYLRLYGGDESKFYWVEEFYYRDVGSRFRLVIWQADDEAGTGAVAVTQVFVGSGALYDQARQAFDFEAMGGSGITGKVIIDFSDEPASFAVYAASVSFANAGLPIGILAPQPDVSPQIESALAIEAQLGNVPFVGTARSTTLRSVVRGAWLYGCVPDHGYHVRRLELNAGDTPYARIYVRDSDDDADRSLIYIIAPSPMSWGDFLTYLDTNFSDWVATDEAYAANGLIGNFKLNWLAATTPGVYDFTATTGGFRADALYIDGRTADYTQSDHYHQRVAVAAADFRTVVESFQNPDGAVAIGAKAHYAHRVRLFCYEEATYDATYLDIPWYVELEGMGRGRTFIKREDNTNHALIEGHYALKAFDITCVSETAPNYAWHSDAFNRYLGGDNSGPLVQVRSHRQKFVRVDFLLASGNLGNGFGSGISSGSRIDFVDCRAFHADTPLPLDDGGGVNAGWLFHNTGPTNSNPTILHSYLPAEVNMAGCSSLDDHLESIILQSLDPSAQCRLSLHDCDLAMVRHEVGGSGEMRTDLARDRVQWVITGKHEGPFIFNDGEGAWVLGVAAGTSVAGDAAPLIFGTVDELGRGEKYVGGGQFTIGNRLGDCSSVNKTITLGGVSKVFNTNLTGVSNATILASVNAVPGMPLLSLVDIKLEWYPDCGFKRRVLNDTGSVIPKGRFIKRVGRGKVELAQPGDRIWGWTYRAIMPGQIGDVVTARKVWYEFIQGAVGDDDPDEGQFGIAADGVFDADAAIKVGECVGGTITLF